MKNKVAFLEIPASDFKKAKRILRDGIRLEGGVVGR